MTKSTTIRQQVPQPASAGKGATGATPSEFSLDLLIFRLI